MRRVCVVQIHAAFYFQAQLCLLLKRKIEKSIHRENYCRTISLALWGCFQFGIFVRPSRAAARFKSVRLFNWVGENRIRRAHGSAVLLLTLTSNLAIRELITQASKLQTLTITLCAPSCFQVKLSTSLMAHTHTAQRQKSGFSCGARCPSMEKANTLARQVTLTITVIKRSLELISLKTIIKCV